MKTTKRRLLIGSATAALMTSTLAKVAFAKLPLGQGGESRQP